jgi:preprotein translocase subunit SecD
MLQFSKIKIFAIIAVCIFAIAFAAPSFLSGFSDNSLVKKTLNYLPQDKVNLGLDLRGGSQLMLEVDFDYYISEQIHNLSQEIKSFFREDSIGAIFQDESEKITILLSDKSQKTAAIKLIKKLSRNIEIDEDEAVISIYFSADEINLIKQNLIQQSIEIIRRRVDETGTREPTIQAQGQNRILLQVPGIKDSAQLKSILGKTAKLTFHFVDDSGFSSEVMQISDRSGFIYPIKKEVILSGDLLIDASTTYHEGQPAVSFRFNALGSRKFAQITAENIGKLFAIVLDGKVVTAPRINSVINQGSGVISGSFTVQEANEVALLLRAGALPAPLKIIEERTVGPSLGLDSIKSGAIASVAGLIFVAIFMVIFYGIFGLIANFAMLINIILLFAALALLNATLTLPGIAGIVLTIGMAIDANVLIFERIKEELRIKKSLLAAVEQGFSQAYRTILDSNLTTLIVAFFLYAFGNGSVKGFAVTLSFGIISSMFSAIILSRMIIAIYLKKFRPRKLQLI